VFVIYPEPNINVAMVLSDKKEGLQACQSGWFQRKNVEGNDVLQSIVLEKRANYVTASISLEQHSGMGFLCKLLYGCGSISGSRSNIFDLFIALGRTGFEYLLIAFRADIRRWKKTSSPGRFQLNASRIATHLLASLGILPSTHIPQKRRRVYPTMNSSLSAMNDDIQNEDDDNVIFPLSSSHITQHLNSSRNADLDVTLPSKCVEYLASIIENGNLVCVNENLFVFPMYDPKSGVVKKSLPALYYICSDGTFVPCNCPLSTEAFSFFNADQSGFEYNQCWHSSIAKDANARQRLLQMAPPRPPGNTHPYLILLAGFEPADAHYVHA
jgi:hypothetical protein